MKITMPEILQVDVRKEDANLLKRIWYYMFHWGLNRHEKIALWLMLGISIWEKHGKHELIIPKELTLTEIFTYCDVNSLGWYKYIGHGYVRFNEDHELEIAPHGYDLCMRMYSWRVKRIALKKWWYRRWWCKKEMALNSQDQTGLLADTQMMFVSIKKQRQERGKNIYLHPQIEKYLSKITKNISYYFYCSIQHDSDLEFVKILDVKYGTNELVIERGCLGTEAREWPKDSSIELVADFDVPEVWFKHACDLIEEMSPTRQPSRPEPRRR